jgi:mono/diheme cytochrome c family protein
MGLVAACAASDAQRPDDGEETFQNVCSKCHGARGEGGLPITPGGPKPRDLTDPVWQASKSDAELEQWIREGRTPMPAFKTVLTGDQIRAVVGKVRRLRKDKQ